MSKLLIELVLTPESAPSARRWGRKLVSESNRAVLVRDGEVQYPVWCWANARLGRNYRELPPHTVEAAMLVALEGLKVGDWSINAPVVVVSLEPNLIRGGLDDREARPWTVNDHRDLHQVEHERISHVEEGLDAVLNPEMGMRADHLKLADRVEKLAAVIVANRKEARDATDTTLPARIERVMKRIDAVYSDLDRRLRLHVHRFENQVPIPPPPPQPFPDTEPTAYYDILFDGPPGPVAGRFIEAEDDQGRSVNLGTWVRRPGDGDWWALRIRASSVRRDGSRPGARPIDPNIRAGWYTTADIELLEVMAVEAAGERRLAKPIGRVFQDIETARHQLHNEYVGMAPGDPVDPHDIMRHAYKEAGIAAALLSGREVSPTAWSAARGRMVGAAALLVAAIERYDFVEAAPLDGPTGPAQPVNEIVGLELLPAPGSPVGAGSRPEFPPEGPTLSEPGHPDNEDPAPVLESPGGDPTSSPEAQGESLADLIFGATLEEGIGGPAMKALGDALGVNGPTVEKLGRFNHHPDTVIDYEMEVEILEGLAYDASVGMTGALQVLDRVRKALDFQVGGDESAVSAKASLREIEGKLAALCKSRQESDAVPEPSVFLSTDDDTDHSGDEISVEVDRG